MSPGMEAILRRIGCGRVSSDLGFMVYSPNTASKQLLALTATATLVILDGVTEAMTLHGYDLHSNADIAAFYHLLPRPIADTGPAASPPRRRSGRHLVGHSRSAAL